MKLNNKRAVYDQNLDTKKSMNWNKLIRGESLSEFKSLLMKHWREKRSDKKNLAEIILSLYPIIYKYSETALRLTKLPLLNKTAHVLLDTSNSNTSYIPIHESLDAPESTAAPISIVEHFIRKSSHRFIMAFCPCRSSNDCEKHPQDIGCIWVGRATAELDLPEEIGRHASVDEAIAHLHRARDAGLITVFGKLRPDAQAMGVGKNDKQFMTICNCCSCCCMVKYLQFGKPELNKIVHKLKGLNVHIDTDKCVGCGTCADACIFNNITIEGKKACIQSDCKGCGFCANACPKSSITINVDDPTFIEEAILRINDAVDVA